MDLIIQYKIPVENPGEAQTIVSELRDGSYDLNDVLGGVEDDFTAYLEIS